MSSDDESFRSKSYLIIGAGVFGLSTARELLLQGARNVRVIDKSPTLPAPDGSSTDINRIVRSSYSDPLYTSLARESIDLWKKDFPGIYRESGVLVLGNSGYCRLAEENDLAAGANITSVPDRTSLESQFSRDIPLGNFSAVESDTSKGFGYLNHSGGWADARAGMAELRDKVLSLGGVIEPGISLMKITFGGEFQDVALVVTRKANLEKEEDMSEEVITADTVIVATGAWTPSLFPDPELGVTKRMTSVGQSVATIILSEKEYQEYRRIPVVVDFESGFYIFPPNEQRLLKMAIHDGGYINLIDSSNATNLAISTPRTTSTHGNEGLKIPLLMVERLRKGLRSIYPALGNHPFTSTRLCWCDYPLYHLNV
ncbi:hypothetical protein FRC02_010332 [Tulasnella sp. 418]|nr:hypothetical protein FRC02_010332 [Tulasnella sp. 418]